MKYYGPVKTAFVIVPPANPTENNVSKSKKEAIFLQLRHYLASIAAFVIVGPVIYLVEQNQIANQVQTCLRMLHARVFHMHLNLCEAMEPLHHLLQPVHAPITPEPSVISSDPVIIAIALAGCNCCIFCSIFWNSCISKFRKIKK